MTTLEYLNAIWSRVEKPVKYDDFFKNSIKLNTKEDVDLIVNTDGELSVLSLLVNVIKFLTNETIAVEEDEEGNITKFVYYNKQS